MSEHLETAKQDGTITIAVKGGFNANLVHKFRGIFDDIESSDHSIIIDLGEAEYIDSAALGLMLHMRKKFQNTKIERIRVINSNARIRKVFQTMHFQEMFEIDMVGD